MRSFLFLSILFGAVETIAQDTTSSSSTITSSSSHRSSSAATDANSGVLPTSLPGSIVKDPTAIVPTGPYVSVSGQVTAATTLPGSSFTTGSMARNSSSSSSNPYLIVGGTATMSGNTTSTSTTSSATATNTQPCNNYPEFCGRKYSNITEVAAHNAAFVRKNNAFSNQQIEITGQLNDGVRMIQGEVHYENKTLYNCHSNCNFLNVGPYEDLLVTVREWIQANPYDVVTLLIVNSDFANVTAFREPFENSGILDYIYLPPRRPMRLSDWPTLEEMILTNKRVVAFMDYNADASLVPYILDEFANMWETPFSPTNPTFPCTEQRPPNLAQNQARDDYLYLANHNLNVELSLGGTNVLIPNFADLALVNADNSSAASLLTMAETCNTTWGRPPNFLLVDFYNFGSGSVFEVAARMNNVTYNRPCCGLNTGLTAAATSLGVSRWAFGTALMSMLAAMMVYAM